jgi:hypothetical protein
MTTLWGRTKLKKNLMWKLIVPWKTHLAEVEHRSLYLVTGIRALIGCTEGENRNYWDWYLCYKF